MVHISEIEARVAKLGVKLSRWYGPELQELQHVLEDHEQIVALVPGRYFGGYALLVATDHRVLLIDKRTFYLTLEDIRYDMISEIDFNARMFDATLQIFTVNKQHKFTSSKYRAQLRTLTYFVQQQILALRQRASGRPAFTSQPQTNVSPVPIREAYPTRAVTPAHFTPATRFAPPERNFNKFGNLAIRAAHRFSPHAHLPHPHMPHLQAQSPSVYFSSD